MWQELFLWPHSHTSLAIFKLLNDFVIICIMRLSSFIISWSIVVLIIYWWDLVSSIWLFGQGTRGTVFHFRSRFESNWFQIAFASLARQKNHFGPVSAFKTRPFFRLESFGPSRPSDSKVSSSFEKDCGAGATIFRTKHVRCVARERSSRRKRNQNQNNTLFCAFMLHFFIYIHLFNFCSSWDKNVGELGAGERERKRGRRKYTSNKNSL